MRLLKLRDGPCSTNCWRRRADSRLNRAEFVQPVLSAVQMALAELWNSWGVRPDFVAAHSIGEWAAACVSGTLSVEETMRVVVESSRAQAQAGAEGGMAVVELPEAEVKERIQIWSGEVFIAGCNSPTSTLLSGDADRLKSIVTNWKEEGVMCSLINIDAATHSPFMDSALEGLKASLSGLCPIRAAIPFVSSVNGDYLHGTEMGPEHWARLVRQPVLFTQVIERLARDGCTHLSGNKPASAVERCHPANPARFRHSMGWRSASCRRGDDERGSLLNSLGTLYALGWPIEWPAVTAGGNGDLSLPIFTAQHQVLEVDCGPRGNAIATPSFRSHDRSPPRSRTITCILPDKRSMTSPSATSPTR